MSYKTLLFLFISIPGLLTTCEENSTKSEMESFYESAKYAQLDSLKTLLTDSLESVQPEIYLLNAHAQFKLKDSVKAFNNYSAADSLGKNLLASTAKNQIALYNIYLGVPDRSKELLKNSLRDNPQNEIARYNLELLEKKRIQRENLLEKIMEITRKKVQDRLYVDAFQFISTWRQQLPELKKHDKYIEKLKLLYEVEKGIKNS